MAFKTLKTEVFDLEKTITSGQIFRYRKIDDRFYVCRRDQLIWVRQRGDILEYSGIDEPVLREFLGIDHDLPAVLRRLKKIPQLRDAVSACRGLRIVRHDPWECLVSFICSTRSNIPKIARSLNKMAELFGTPIACGDVCEYGFPPHGSLSDPQKLRATGVGYRADYLAQTNCQCTADRLERLAACDYRTAREELKKLPGVGDKVADCVCLFALGFLEAFPVDVWIARAMQQLFPDIGKKEKDIREKALDIFGQDAGYAQQYLFHHQRMLAGRAG